MAIAKLKPGYSKLPSIPPDIPNIFQAAENNNLRALELALAHYDVNVQDENGMTPLHYAASTLSARAIDRLLAQPGIDATLADRFGRSAVTVAFECWNDLAANIMDKLNPHCYPWLYPIAPPPPSPTDS
jgi:hypothetical protein